MVNLEKKYKNDLTLLEFCYYKKYQKVLNYAYNMKLKNLYKDEEFLNYCENGNFAGVCTNVLNGVDLN